MSKVRMAATCFAALGVVGASAALAVDLPDPVYTYCEVEDRYGSSNDVFDSIETFTAPTEFSECFYITGKLQKDCIWDREPKCCIAWYDKPTEATDALGRPLGVVEELLGVSDPFGPETRSEIAIPVLEDGTIRIAVTSIFDCFDGTVNGLFSNGIHEDTGYVKLFVGFDDVERGSDDYSGENIEEYKFEFQGNDALRLAYIAPPGASTAIIQCIEDHGEQEICYDVDYYWVDGLEPRELYCITQVGGKTYDCEATDTVLGWFDKLGFIQGGLNGIGDTGSSNVFEYAEICVLADDLGSIRFAISGTGDENFNGLDDMQEETFFLFLEDEEYIPNDNDAVKGEGWVPGASTKDNIDDVVRLSREDFDASKWSTPPAHEVCGCYTLKVRLNPHVDEDDSDSDGGTGGTSLHQRADLTGDGQVDAADLATLLSFWGLVQ